MHGVTNSISACETFSNMDPAEPSSRRNLQVGGAGEGNLPKASYAILSEKDTFSLLSSILANLGPFKSDMNKSVVTEAVKEFALPYVPWARKTARKRSIDRGEEYNENGKFGRESVLVRCKTRKKKDVSKVLNPPELEAIPRLRRFSTLQDLMDCWRYGNSNRHVPPLYTLSDSTSRRLAWPGYTDSWWKQSSLCKDEENCCSCETVYT